MVRGVYSIIVRGDHPGTDSESPPQPLSRFQSHRPNLQRSSPMRPTIVWPAACAVTPHAANQMHPIPSRRLPGRSRGAERLHSNRTPPLHLPAWHPARVSAAALDIAADETPGSTARRPRQLHDAAALCSAGFTPPPHSAADPTPGPRGECRPRQTQRRGSLAVTAWRRAPPQRPQNRSPP